MRLSIILRAVILPILALVVLRLLFRSSQTLYVPVGIFVVAFLLLADLATLARGGLQNACVVAASLALGLAGIETVAEARMPHVVLSHMALWQPDSVLGYHAEKPGVIAAVKTVDGHLAYRVHYTIDDKLRRLTRSSADGAKVRFFGDSYTFGEGLDDAETLPQRFADMTGANVENYGYPGFSPAQALRALQLGLDDNDLAGARLFILQTAPFHVERVVCKPDFSRGFPRYVVQDDKLVLDGRCNPAHGQSTGIYRMLLQAQDRKIGRADVETYIDVVEAFIALAQRKYHASVLVVDMIRGSQDLRDTGFTSAQIEARFRGAGAVVIDDLVSAKPHDVLGIVFDGHPSATADALYARKIADTIQKVWPGYLRPEIAQTQTRFLKLPGTETSRD